MRLFIAKGFLNHLNKKVIRKVTLARNEVHVRPDHSAEEVLASPQMRESSPRTFFPWGCGSPSNSETDTEPVDLAVTGESP